MSISKTRQKLVDVARQLFAVFLPTFVWASTPNKVEGDTTIVYKDTQVKVETLNGETRVSVYNKKGDALTMVRETTYVDGNEVEKVYVGSPFATHGLLQTDRLNSTLPTIWWAPVFTQESLASSKTENIQTKRAGSFEIGVTPYSHCFPLEKSHSWGLTTGIQGIYVRQSYNHGFLLAMRNDQVATTNDHGYRARHSAMTYFGVRVPLLVTMDCSRSRSDTYSISLGVDVEWRTNGSFKYTNTGNNPEVCNDIHLNHWGMGIVEQIKMGPIVINGRIGVTPLYKTTTGKKAFSSSIGIGFDLWECLGKKH